MGLPLFPKGAYSRYIAFPSGAVETRPLVAGNVPFPHRLNRDGSHDAICPKCFITIATDCNEAALAEAEKSHVCGAPIRVDWVSGRVTSVSRTKRTPHFSR